MSGLGRDDGGLDVIGFHAGEGGVGFENRSGLESEGAGRLGAGGEQLN